MSAKLFASDIRFFQRILAVAGFYKGPLDGKLTSKVKEAQDEFIKDYEATKAKMGSFDDRTEMNIRTLIPAAQVKAREFMSIAAKGHPLTCRIISGTRTFAEQDVLFKQKPKVTNARGGQSNHNFGIAWDVGIFDTGKFLTGATKKEDKAYSDLGALITKETKGIEWGGNWKTFVDKPHYQLATGKSVKQLLALLEKGESFA